MNKVNLAVLQYMMPKVGSKTVQKSLEAYNFPVYYYTHYLSQKNLEQHYFNVERIQNYYQNQYLCNYLKRGLNRKWKIITLIREPVARNISQFFHKFSRQDKIDQIPLETLRVLFLKYFRNHDQPLTWFDEEMKAILGIDVFATEFPKTKGYKIYKGNHPDLLLIKLENLGDTASVAFKEFLGIEGLTLYNTNRAQDHYYYSLYQKFILAKLIPRTYIRKMYASKFAKHFYTEDELNEFREKWLSNTQ